MSDNVYKSPISIAGGSEIMACNTVLALNTYMNCSHNCTYCYARYIGYLYGRWDPRNPIPTDPEIIRKYLTIAFKRDYSKYNENWPENSKHWIYYALYHKVPFRFSNLTDPFQPAEKKYRVTLKTMKILKEFDYPYIINTKSDLVSEDPYLDLLKDSKAIVQVTLISLDRKLLKKIEPNSPSPQRRIDALKTISEAGIPTQVRISPIFPMLTDDITDLIKELKEVGVNDIISEFLRYSTPIKRWIEEALSIDLAQIFKEYGCRLDEKGNPKRDPDGYVRVSVSKKYEVYKKHKRQVESLGMNYYVCSEEDPTINDCTCCCGTNNYEGFERTNDASVNTIYQFMIDRGITSLEDIKNNFFCVNWKKFTNMWNKGDIERLLVGMKVDGELSENTRYVYCPQKKPPNFSKS